MFTLSTEKTYHRKNLRQALIDISLEVIAEQGVRALTLREIGARLNVSRMAPYRHFKDKSALLAAITTAGFTKFTEALEEAIRGAGDDFVRQADALAVAYVRFALENRAHFEVMFGGGGEPQYLDQAGGEIAKKSFLVLENLVRRGQEQKLVLPGNPTTIAQMIWATVHGISTLGFAIDEKAKTFKPEIVIYCASLLRCGLEPR